MQGWIKLHRKILDNELWYDVSTFRLFTFLLLKAAHKDGVKVNGHVLKQGQYIRSYRLLAHDLSYKEGRGLKQYSTSTVKRCSAKLIENGMITVDETELGTLFTIINYASYQHLSNEEEETQNGTKNVNRTNPERSPNNNKNVRIKELGVVDTREENNHSQIQSDGAPVTENKVSPEVERRKNKLAECFIKVRGSGVYLKNDELFAIEKAVEMDVPIEMLMTWVEEIVLEHNSKWPYDKVQNFKFCVRSLNKRYHEHKNQNIVQFGSQKPKTKESISERMARLKREGRIPMGGEGS
ncbi:hypothetical protein [Domibacillus mangrovi]|uniref:DnaD domain-containing protein n=1 Tax=Domibacillus mangrovi TaxID=1714354 RepID=A0A1Q5P427_9BACI|nr:hypothetical protein [Domibacillus mangrovi]OKL37019.1 hypothetical protein BLL40_05355 [Domibacillus mangrovi]